MSDKVPNAPWNIARWLALFPIAAAFADQPARVYEQQRFEISIFLTFLSSMHTYLGLARRWHKEDHVGDDAGCVEDRASCHTTVDQPSYGRLNLEQPKVETQNGQLDEERCYSVKADRGECFLHHSKHACSDSLGERHSLQTWRVAFVMSSALMSHMCPPKILPFPGASTWNVFRYSTCMVRLSTYMRWTQRRAPLGLPTQHQQDARHNCDNAAHKC